LRLKSIERILHLMYYLSAAVASKEAVVKVDAHFEEIFAACENHRHDQIAPGIVVNFAERDL